MVRKTRKEEENKMNRTKDFCFCRLFSILATSNANANELNNDAIHHHALSLSQERDVYTYIIPIATQFI